MLILTGCNGQRCLDLNVGPEGLTPLHDAVSVNQTTVARILLQYGGNVPYTQKKIGQEEI